MLYSATIARLIPEEVPALQPRQTLTETIAELLEGNQFMLNITASSTSSDVLLRTGITVSSSGGILCKGLPNTCTTAAGNVQVSCLTSCTALHSGSGSVTVAGADPDTNGQQRSLTLTILVKASIHTLVQIPL